MILIQLNRDNMRSFPNPYWSISKPFCINKAFLTYVRFCKHSWKLNFQISQSRVVLLHFATPSNNYPHVLHLILLSLRFFPSSSFLYPLFTFYPIRYFSFPIYLKFPLCLTYTPFSYFHYFSSIAVLSLRFSQFSSLYLITFPYSTYFLTTHFSRPKLWRFLPSATKAWNFFPFLFPLTLSTFPHSSSLRSIHLPSSTFRNRHFFLVIFPYSHCSKIFSFTLISSNSPHISFFCLLLSPSLSFYLYPACRTFPYFSFLPLIPISPSTLPRFPYFRSLLLNSPTSRLLSAPLPKEKVRWIYGLSGKWNRKKSGKS